MAPVERLYTSDQVHRALERAAELESGSEVHEVGRPLYGRAELEAIARESGIALKAPDRALVGSTELLVFLGLALSFSVAFGLARYLYARKVKTETKKLEALLDELRTTLEPP